MANMWLPGTDKVDLGDHGAMDGGSESYVTTHITWDENGTAAHPIDLVPFSQLRSYFGFNSAGKGVAPHLLWDPFTGRTAQFYPADSRSKSLVNLDGGITTNRHGKYNIQIETLFFPFCRWNGKSYAQLTDTPCKGLGEIVKWTESLGIPSRYPKGFPNGTSQRGPLQGSGWYGHSQWPENQHTDPITWPQFPAVSASKPPVKLPDYHAPVFPGRANFYVGAYNKFVTALDRELVRLKFTKHNDGNGYQPGPRYTEYTRRNVVDFQKSNSHLSGDPDGLVGPLTWSLLFTTGR